MGIYEELGGRAVVDLVVDLFYRRLLADPELAPYFSGVDLAEQMQRQCLFMAFALGRVTQYAGRPIRDAHRGLGLTDQQFDRVAMHLAGALAEIGVSDRAIAKVMAIVASTRSDIVDLPPP